MASSERLRTALVVDDSRTIRNLLASYMVELGFEVVTAVDGREAIEKIVSGGAPAVALVDWHMPVLDGLGFLRELRQHGDWSFPVMMVTSESRMERVREALLIGASEFLMKPFDKAMVRDKLALLGFEMQE